MLNNVRGYKSKAMMIKRIVSEEEPVIVALVETKLDKEEGVDIPGYEVSRVDRDKDGGGVLLAYKKCMDSIIIETSELKLYNAEILWKKVNNGKVKIKIGVIYMPQECRTTLLKLKEIYRKIEKEISDAREKGEKIIIMGDLNCKVGTIIEGNTEEITKGGRLLLKLVKKYRLKIVNAETSCQGLWTRIEGTCKSILDYIIVFEDDLDLVRTMEIDEGKDITPYYVEKVGGKETRTYTDHCMMTINMNISMGIQKSKTYAYVLDKEGIERFQKRLKEEKVSKIIEKGDIRESYKIWSDKVLQIRSGCCKRIKIKKRWKVCRILTKAKKSITKELKTARDKERIKDLKERREILCKQIEQEEQKKENARLNKIVAEVKKAGGINSNTFWEVRKRLCGNKGVRPHAMKNKEGVLCEEADEIKQIHKEWFQELLETKEGTTEGEKRSEEIVNLVWESMKAIAKQQPSRVTTKEEVETIVKKLDPKKAKDSESWKNSVIKDGGEEMIESLTKISNQVDDQKLIPREWQKMGIKTIPKPGEKFVMENKRGLFMTNNVSKVYERTVKGRNDDQFREGITEWHAGGVTERAPIDITMTMLAIIEQNKYLKRNTYLVFTDAEKCFDKLWLLDGICELWRCGTDVRDCIMIKKLNENAEIVVKTPVGDTEPFNLLDIVRQGSVYGPQICISSMDKINILGKDVGTFYAPDLLLKAGVFIDDVTAGGGINTANNIIYNCSLMEEKKKMTFNNKEGKTEYMVIGNFNEEERTVSQKVKKGVINRVKEHKMLGTWVDETGNYGINIWKKKEKLSYMIGVVKMQASPRALGIFAIGARLKLAEILVVSSILFNIEAFPVIKATEIKELDSVQLLILTSILELPKTTPYFALLMEVGWWPIKARISYKKLMLFHNIMRSHKRRVLKKLLLAQERENRETTWLAGVRKEMERYNIELDVMVTQKSAWKKHAKKNINMEVEKEIRVKCKESKKARIVKDDGYERKSYMDGEIDLTMAKKILRTRLNMCRLPGNYKGNGSGICTLCEEEEGSTEHYFDCKYTSSLAKVWGVTTNDLRSHDVSKMKDVARFIDNVEILINPEV